MKHILLFFSSIVLFSACVKKSDKTSDAKLDYVSGAFRGDNPQKISHGFLIEAALEALRTNLKLTRRPDVILYLIDHKSGLQLGGDLPDRDETDVFMHTSSTYKGHFYNPLTKKNYFGEKDTTAMTRFIEHNIKAKQAHKDSNFPVMIEEIGRATHFLADVCVPHHAANAVVYSSNHQPFERFLNTLMQTEPSKYRIKNFIEVENENYEELLHNSALKAFSLFREADSKLTNKKDGTPDYSRWLKVADELIPYTEQVLATYMEKFANDVEYLNTH